MVEKYENKSKVSGITHFQIGDNFIELKFETSNFIYKYNHVKPGKIHVNEMKELAQNGDGLGTYRNKYVKSYFSKKLSWSNTV